MNEQQKIYEKQLMETKTTQNERISNPQTVITDSANADTICFQNNHWDIQQQIDVIQSSMNR